MRAELVGAGVDDLGVRRRLAEAHVDDDLLDLGDGHHVRVAELLRQRRDDVLLVLAPSAGSFVDHSLALAADADLAAVAENLVADARLRAALGADQLHVRGVQRRLALDDAALDVLAAGSASCGA